MALTWSGSIPTMLGGSACSMPQGKRFHCSSGTPGQAPPANPACPIAPHHLFFLSASFVLHFSESRN